MKASFPLPALLALIVAAFLPPLFSPRSASAQPLPPLPIQFDPDQIVNPGRPGGRRRGGASRGECSLNASSGSSLSAIAYARTVVELGIERADETAGALTTQAQPTLWFYLPSALSDQTQASLVVKDSRDQLVYEGQLSGKTDSDGIVSLPMPVNLEVGIPYHWFLTLDCGAEESSGESSGEFSDESFGEQTTVDGWIERRAVDAPLSRALSEANARNRAALYANAGFLQDATTELAALRLANRADVSLAQDWVSFLSTLDLSDLAAAPLLECCGLIDMRSLSPQSTPTEPEISNPAEENSVEPKEPAEEPDRRTILQRARDRD
ncbi:MAG: DUF928 domain-containing protein [Phormidesmis sp.]